MYSSYQTKNEYIEQIIEKYADMVYRLALSRTRNIENSQDVFQEVFYRLSKKMPEFKSEEHTKAWLIRVTINCSKTLLGSKWNTKIETLEENMCIEEPQVKEILEEVLELPQKYRTVIHLYYYEDLTIKEIAKVLRTNENTVKTWLARARNKLKHKMEGGIENDK